MPTPRTGADRARRQELLEGIAAYLLRHGVAGMSLRPMAATLGTSALVIMERIGRGLGM